MNINVANILNVVNKYRTFDNIVDDVNALNETAKFDSVLSEEDANETNKYNETDTVE